MNGLLIDLIFWPAYLLIVVRTALVRIFPPRTGSVNLSSILDEMALLLGIGFDIFETRLISLTGVLGGEVVDA